MLQENNVIFLKFTKCPSINIESIEYNCQTLSLIHLHLAYIHRWKLNYNKTQYALSQQFFDNASKVRWAKTLKHILDVKWRR